MLLEAFESIDVEEVRDEVLEPEIETDFLILDIKKLDIRLRRCDNGRVRARVRART